MANLTFDKEINALLVIDPYNGFISESGKVWDRLKGVASGDHGPGSRARRHCCKTSLAKPRALAAWCMESQAFRSAPRSSWKSFLS